MFYVTFFLVRIFIALAAMVLKTIYPFPPTHSLILMFLQVCKYVCNATKKLKVTEESISAGAGYQRMLAEVAHIMTFDQNYMLFFKQVCLPNFSFLLVQNSHLLCDFSLFVFVHHLLDYRGVCQMIFEHIHPPTYIYIFVMSECDVHVSMFRCWWIYMCMYSMNGCLHSFMHLWSYL